MKFFIFIVFRRIRATQAVATLYRHVNVANKFIRHTPIHQGVSHNFQFGTRHLHAYRTRFSVATGYFWRVEIGIWGQEKRFKRFRFYVMKQCLFLGSGPKERAINHLRALWKIYFVPTYETLTFTQGFIESQWILIYKYSSAYLPCMNVYEAQLHITCSYIFICQC